MGRKSVTDKQTDKQTDISGIYIRIVDKIVHSFGNLVQEFPVYNNAQV